MRRCDADYFSVARFGHRIARNLLPNPFRTQFGRREREIFPSPTAPAVRAGRLSHFSFLPVCFFTRPARANSQWQSQSETTFTGCCWQRSASAPTRLSPLNQFLPNQARPNLPRGTLYRFSLHNQVRSPVASPICILPRSPASHSSCATRPPAQKLALAHRRTASSAFPRLMQLRTLSTPMRQISATAASKGLSLPAALNPACRPRWLSILSRPVCFRPQLLHRFLARPPRFRPHHSPSCHTHYRRAPNHAALARFRSRSVICNKSANPRADSAACIAAPSSKHNQSTTHCVHRLYRRSATRQIFANSDCRTRRRQIRNASCASDANSATIRPKAPDVHGNYPACRRPTGFCARCHRPAGHLSIQRANNDSSLTHCCCIVVCTSRAIHASANTTSTSAPRLAATPGP